MNDGRPLHVISGDQGFLPAPVSVKQLSLAPGERREILVDMSNGDEVSITCGEAASIVDRIRGFFEPSSILVSTTVLTLRPTGLLPLVTDSLPMRLLPTEIMAGSPIRSRDISLGDDPGINGQLWDVNRIDVTAQQGTWERWTVRADEPQAFHIEGVMFQIRNVNGAMPFPEDRGWKDTVWVDGQVELLVYFGQPSGRTSRSTSTVRRWKWRTVARLGNCWSIRYRNLHTRPRRASMEYLSISLSFRLIIPGL